MQNEIFQINKNYDYDTYKYTYYTLFGNHSELDTEGNPITSDEKRGYAYVRTNEKNNAENYYLKIGLYGKIFNPMGLYSEGKENKFLSKIGKNEYNFTKVNKKVFDMYINFLRTKNIAWLNNAERELT